MNRIALGIIFVILGLSGWILNSIPNMTISELAWLLTMITGTLLLSESNPKSKITLKDKVLGVLLVHNVDLTVEHIAEDIFDYTSKRAIGHITPILAQLHQEQLIRIRWDHSKDEPQRVFGINPDRVFVAKQSASSERD